MTSVLSMESRDKTSLAHTKNSGSLLSSSLSPQGRKDAFFMKQEKIQNILNVHLRPKNKKFPTSSASTSSFEKDMQAHHVEPEMMPFLNINKLDLDQLRPSTVGGMDKKNNR